jgi:ABC-type antimicrobial peptide transport system permease subunit
VRGRNLTPADADGAARVVLVNEAFVATFFPGRDPIGQEVEVRHRPDSKENRVQTVVGVVANIKQAGVDKPAGTEVFIPASQLGSLWEPPIPVLTLYVVLRTEGEPGDLIPAVQRAVAAIDPTLPLFEMRTMDDVMWEAVARPRFLTFLLTAFAGIALLLAAVGIFGVMAHTVAQRTHEIGLRVALGAQPRQVRAMVLRQAARLVLTGVAAGLAMIIGLQLTLSDALRGLFYDAELSQPVLLVAVSVVVTATALLATWVPARRATRVEPSVALRNE